jgi:hypothetical protein
MWLFDIDQEYRYVTCDARGQKIETIARKKQRTFPYRGGFASKI